MTMGNVRRVAAVAAALVATLGAGVTAYAQKTAGKPASGAKKPPMDPMQAAKANWKANFGFSDAQADALAKKSTEISRAYQPRFQALGKKYGNNLSPEMKNKRDAELIPVFNEMGKKTFAAMMAIATKEQRPRIMAQIKRDQQRLEAMSRQGGTKP